MKNTDKFDCLAVKECIIKGLIDINKLSKEELDVLIDFETDNIIECDTEPDMSFLDTCYDAMHKFEDYSKDISDEQIQELGDKAYIEFTQKQMNTAPAKKPRRFFKRFATVCAAMLAFCFLSFSVAAVALGSYSAAWEYISSNVSAILNLNGSKDVDGITIIKSDYTKKYSTIEELLAAENLDILYPASLPEGVKIERVKVFGFDDGRENILFMLNTDICAIQITNYYSIDLEIIQNYSIYSTNKADFYITKSYDDSYQALAQINNMEYTINCLNYNDLIYILSNMKGISK
jgi:hypothetical protein